MSEQALPPHMRGRKHDDWPWPLSNIPRGFNAKGPRCVGDEKNYISWPPRLVEGHGVARWETANDHRGNHSIIEIPALANVQVKGEDVYGKYWVAIERLRGHQFEGKSFNVFLQLYETSIVIDERQDDGKYVQRITPNNYSPSAIQYFSKKGWMKLSPDYYSQWKWRFKFDPLRENKGPFLRYGWRPDHEDEYYNWGPFAGLKGE